MQCSAGMFHSIVEFHRLADLPRLIGRGRTGEESRRFADLERQLSSERGARENRRWRRAPLVRKAEVWTYSTCAPTMVLDVSAGGFRISGDHALEMHAYVDLVVSGGEGLTFRFPCRVVWTKPTSGEFGLALDGLPGEVRSTEASA